MKAQTERINVVKKHIDRMPVSIQIIAALWMSCGVGAVLFSWLYLQFEVLPLPLP